MSTTIDAALHAWVRFQSGDNQHALRMAAKNVPTGHPLANEIKDWANHRDYRGDALYGKALNHFGIAPVIPD